MTFQTWMKTPKMGIGILLLIGGLLYLFAMVPINSPASTSPYTYMNRTPSMEAETSRSNEMARRELAETQSVFGNTYEESVVTKYFPPVPVPSYITDKLRNVMPHSA
jgi:hypothetical protein